ncbi:fimbria/pilus outer membrane usher protein [Dyella sp. C9]|uniref:fimbria/pilus outer membrane usher protein n=1 Tax=Dyella sp. C9 TaxID=2202154 RepID=UPI000DEEE679|nr:fimbria/pilus outer membrane usher protein [Dyella sp. C9]
MNVSSNKRGHSLYATRSRLLHAPRLRPLTWSVMLALGMVPAAAFALPAAAPASPVLDPAASSLDPVSPAAAPVATADPSVVEFSSAFTASSQAVDVSRFEKGNPVLPGNYNVDIFVNEGRVARKNIQFRAVGGSPVAQPCFDRATLSLMGVDIGKLDAQVADTQNTCIGIKEVSPDASATMDVGELRLDVSVPQDALRRQARGYVSPELWDQGETAFLLGYSFNAYSLDQSYSGSSTQGGTAIATDGSPVQVQGPQYYMVGTGGNYVPSSTGNYMLGLNGQYVPVQRGSYVPGRVGGYSSNDVSAFLGLNMGVNIAGWRIRSQETAQWDQRTGRTLWTNINTTATHDITPWKAQFTIGDGYTQGVVFDTTPFRGITMYSDDRMLPNSQQGYAPVVRGTANTQARVEVRQNGNLLYQTTVAPGPFVIDDLYATGYGGDLTVLIYEADGSMHSFVVPYSAVPMLLRPGISRWSITDGQVHNTALRNDKPYFVEGTYQRGINNWLTAYGGVQSTYRDLYHAYLGGVAVNTPIGAFALDVTNSHTTFEGADSLSGYSTRVSYSKAIPTSGTTFALASYRYSNGNFMSLSDAVVTQDLMTSLHTSSPSVAGLMRSKQRLNVTINQDFGGKYGQLYFNGSRNTYWNGMPDATTYQLGYNNRYRRVNFGITASRTYTAGPMYNGAHYDNQFGINVSIPLGGPSSRNTPMVQFSSTHDDVMGSSDRAGITGTFGKNSEFSYGANLTYSDYKNTDSTTVGSGTLSWQAPYASLNGSYSYSNNYQQASVGATGGVVVHGGGITLAPQLDLNSAIAIVDAPDAKGARVSSSGQTTVDGRGYAVATSLIPYRMNDVTLDPSGTSDDVELQTTRLQTAPRAGAVIPLKFDTVSGRAVLIKATQADGEVIPFGAEVLDASGQSIGVVGQGGQVFVRGAENGGVLTVRWGDTDSQQCRVQYSLPPRVKGDQARMESVTSVCR